MRSLDLRPSAKIVQQLSFLERSAGRWERLSLSSALASEGQSTLALNEGCEAMLSLDPSLLGGLSSLIEVDRAKHDDFFEAPRRSTHYRLALTQLLQAAQLTGTIDRTAIVDCYTAIAKTDAGPQQLTFRQESSVFRISHPGTYDDETVFQTISPFLIEQRLGELLDWLAGETEQNSNHPLFVIGVFHLLLLQISPFPAHNHLLALLLLQRLLLAEGYRFVLYHLPAKVFAVRSLAYATALRQAEKSALANWSTLNIWLEFFLDCLTECARSVVQHSEQKLDLARLTPVQTQILQVVKDQGSASRERIVQQTGILLSTVKYNLSVLATKGHLKREGAGRTTSYCLT